MHRPIDRITHTTVFVTPVMEHWLERNIAQCVHPMKDRSDDACTITPLITPMRFICMMKLTAEKKSFTRNNKVGLDKDG